MCPFCFATLGLVLAGTVSTGGLGPLTMKMSQKKNVGREITPNSSDNSIARQDRLIGLSGMKGEVR